PRDDVRAALHAAAQSLGLAQQLVVALGPAGVVLALVAAVAGVLPDAPAQLVDLLVLHRVVAHPYRLAQVTVADLGEQGGDEVGALLRRAAVEVPRDADLLQRLDRRRDVARAEPVDLPADGQPVRRRPGARRAAALAAP